jgi:hypothetical protein
MTLPGLNDPLFEEDWVVSLSFKQNRNKAGVAMPVLDRSSEPTQETTLEGQVEILGDFRRGKFGDDSGVKHSGLLLKTDSGRMIIHLGPPGYFMKHNFQIKAGDTFKVTGIRVEHDQMPLIQAREIRNHQKELKLWDNGLSLWLLAASGQTT